LRRFKNKTIKKKEGRNCYWTRYYLNGKQYSIYGKSEQEVLKKLKEALNIKQNKEKENKSITLKEWFNKWLTSYKLNKAPSTIKDYEKLFKHIVNIEDKEIKKISHIELCEVIEKTNGDRQKQKVYDLLRQLFEKAKQNELIKNNHMLNINKPSYEAEEKTALDKQQEQLFIQIASNLFKNDLILDYFKICLYAGTRPGEALALKPDKINLDENFIEINESLSRDNPNKTTKNKYSIRKVPIFDNLKNTLINLSKAKQDEYIFNFNYDYVRGCFNKVRELSKIENISIYSLRHTFITRCKEAGLPEFVIQNFVGHKKGSKVTSTTYTHLNKDTLIYNINKLNDFNNKKD